jgi:hypothetical protein
MNVTLWMLDKFLGRRMAREMRKHLNDVATTPERAARDQASAILRVLAARPGPHVMLGETDWGEAMRIPVIDLLRLHALITGGSGSGKTMAMLLMISAILEGSEDFRAGWAVVDGAKADLFLGTLYLIKRRLETLAARDPVAASRFRRRVRIIDFAAPATTVTPFNLLARWPNAEPDSFASHQVDLLLDVLPNGDALKLAAAPLKTLIQILSAPEVGMSVIDLIRVLDDEECLNEVLVRCHDGALVGTLTRQLRTVSRSTRAALRRRLEALVSSTSVARMLAGTTAPDFRRFQDEGCFVAVNCSGPNISGGLSQFLNTLVVSNFCRSVYGRRHPDVPFVVIADESQHLFSSAIMREHLSDAGRLSRRYGTHFWFITQNLSASVQDARLLRLLHTNVGWTWSGRGDPTDCAFLKPVIPVTGRRPRPKREPFEETRFYTDAEERTLLLEEVVNLPNRTGYIWLKGQSSEAVKVRTADLDIPQGAELEKAVLSIRNDATIGQRVSRKEYDRSLDVKQRDERPARNHSDADTALQEAYRRGRAKSKQANGGESA